MVARPRRSVLYMPGSNPKALDKAHLAADAIIIDLEDSVAPDAKAAARALAVEAVRKGGFGGREVVIRVNGPHTPWGAEDLAAAIAAAPDAILLPKVDGPPRAWSPPGRCARPTRHGDPSVGDDGDAEWQSERGLDRRHRRRPGRAARRCGDGPRRPRQGDARPPDPGPPGARRVARHLRRAARAHGCDIIDGVYND